jgi:diacylglycerol kinase (ATP)
MVLERWADRGLIIANPRAGLKDTGFVDAVARHCDRWIGDLTVVRTEHRGHAEEIAAKAPTEAIDVVIVVGGDGTTREAASGLAGAGPAQNGRDVALVNVPGGTGNSFYKEIWSDRPWRLALDTALSGWRPKLRRVDLASVEESRALVLLGVGSGLIAEVTETATRLPDVPGRQRYWQALAQALRRTKPYPGRITVDGQRVHEGDVHLTNIGGGRYRGGRYQLLPRSVIDDGLLDICVVTGDSDVAEVLSLAQEGRHLQYPGVLYARGREIVLERLDGLPVPLEYDGEYERIGQSRYTVSVLAGVLPMPAP